MFGSPRQNIVKKLLILLKGVLRGGICTPLMTWKGFRRRTPIAPYMICVLCGRISKPLGCSMILSGLIMKGITLEGTASHDEAD